MASSSVLPDLALGNLQVKIQIGVSTVAVTTVCPQLTLVANVKVPVTFFNSFAKMPAHAAGRRLFS